jgi:hypothetical protein
MQFRKVKILRNFASPAGLTAHVGEEKVIVEAEAETLVASGSAEFVDGDSGDWVDEWGEV